MIAAFLRESTAASQSLPTAYRQQIYELSKRSIITPNPSTTNISIETYPFMTETQTHPQPEAKAVGKQMEPLRS